MEECDYERVEQFISEGNLQDAQAELDGAKVRPARWHFLQSRLFGKKSWFNESKKQLEIALELDPNNAQYIAEMEKLNALGAESSGEKKEEKPEMDKGRCRDECAGMCTYGCCSLICEGICYALCNGV